MIYKQYTKPCLDFLSSFFLFLLLSPLLVCLALCVRLMLGAPVFFRQERGGKNGSHFKIIKFRTMVDLYDEKGCLLPDEKRLTRFGSFLRKTSLDEIPALFNVIRGEMSLVGPRPLLVEYLEHYDEYQMRRHLVTPGITGWAQVKGRNSLTWDEKFRFDIDYVERQSFFLT
ncbi:MAG: sugar transferase [Legionellaceae bacterium]|nr:sugar transferase [Legionellaceae bacterium]